MKTFDILLVVDQILDPFERHKLAYGLENSMAPFKISPYLPLTQGIYIPLQYITNAI
jgi:hypothetical protein